MEINIIEISGFVSALKGLRLPFKKDVRSFVEFKYTGFTVCCDNDGLIMETQFIPDEKDVDLLKSLIRQGDSDAKVLRFIDVSLEINAPRFFWSEWDTYKVGTVTISESTMHTILKDKLTPDNFDSFTSSETVKSFIDYAEDIAASDIDNKLKLAMIKPNLPEGFLQKRIVKLNYQTLRHIYFDRRNHKLSQWQEFCDFIESLPMSKLITLTI